MHADPHRASGGATLNEQIAEVARECAMRERAYGRWVTDGRLTALESATRIRRMRAALSTLETLRAQQRGAQPELDL